MQSPEALPPHNIEAEKAVLGSLLLDSDAIAKLYPWFGPENFLRNEHRIIYEAMRQLYRENAPVDIVTLADLLNRKGSLASVGIPLIHTLATLVPTAIHIEYYARIVQRAAIKRRIIQVGAQFAKVGYDGEIDVDEALRKCREMLSELIHSDKGRFEGIFKVADAYDEVYRLYDEGWKPGEATCWPEFDRHFRVASGELTVVTGIPNHGKSEWVDGLCVDFAKRLGWGVAMYSPENWPIKGHIAKLVEKWVGAPFNAGQSMRVTESELQTALGQLHEHFTFVMPSRGQRGMQSLVGQFEAVIAKEPNVKLVVIDPYNKLEHRRTKEKMISEYTSEALDMMTELAKTTGVHVLLVVHPHQMEKKWNKEKSKNMYPVPGIYDINDGAAFANKADNIIVVYRDVGANDGNVQFHVQKVRNKQNGRPGRVDLLWDQFSGNFQSMVNEPEIPLPPEPKDLQRAML